MELIISLGLMSCLILFGLLSIFKVARDWAKKKWNAYIVGKLNEIINAKRSNGKH